MEIEMKVDGMLKFQPGSVQILLAEDSDDENKKMLSFSISDWDAFSIAAFISKELPERPLTHDLVKKIFESYGIVFEKVVVNALKGGIFFAEIHHKNKDQSLVSDARPSDAIALALRFRCPIFVESRVFEELKEEKKRYDQEQYSLSPRINERDMAYVLENFDPKYGQ